MENHRLRAQNNEAQQAVRFLAALIEYYKSLAEDANQRIERYERQLAQLTVSILDLLRQDTGTQRLWALALR